MFIPVLLLFLIYPFENNDAARILAIFPTPSVSHQRVFQNVYHELVLRGHELVKITAHPFPREETPGNLTEIDIRDLMFKLYEKYLTVTEIGLKSKIYRQCEICKASYMPISKELLLSEKIQKIIQNKQLNFDLIILECHFVAGLLFSFIFKAPTIIISSFSSVANYENMGAPVHHLYYPSINSHKIYNNDFWDLMNDVFLDFYLANLHLNRECYSELIKSIVPNADNVKTLQNKFVTNFFVNINPIWEGNRPVPASVVHLGGLHQRHQRESLSKDLKSYLDSSINGVIYTSFGTNVNPSLIPKEKIYILMKVLSEMPYDVLLKWNIEELPGKPKNIRVAKWFPQSELLKHPKIKLFITQAGLQSTDEAITAGVPLIGIPMLFDQWNNADKYVVHKIGMKIELETLTEEELADAIHNVIDDESYRNNVIQLRILMNDQPQHPLERAVWWTEHVLRHGGAHLRSVTANMPWTEELEVELIAIVVTVLLFCISVILFIVRYLFLYITKCINMRYFILSNKY